MAKFKTGVAANPKGRPKGVPDKRSALKKLIEPLAPDLINIVYDLAKKGDLGACRLLLDKCLANQKPESEPQRIPIKMDGTPAEQSQRILEAIAAGTIAADVGSQLIRAVSDAINIQAQTEMLDRLTALEEGTSK